MFGPKFQETWRGTDEKVGLSDTLRVLGLGLSQLSAGQPANVVGAWDAVQKRRDERKLGAAMRDPSLMAGFTPEQQSMLAQMPPQMAQQLIMEKVFAPPAEPKKPEYREFDGKLYEMSSGSPVEVLAGTPEAQPAPMSPQDRDFWGIPKDDTRTYVLGKDGVPEPIGEMPKGPDMPSSVDEYNFYKAQEESAGRPVLSFADWDMQGKKAGATTVNTGGGSDKQIFDTLAASSDKATSAAVGLNGLAEASTALDKGAITGFAADQRLYLAKLGNYLGVSDPAAVENTETFRAAIAPQVSAMIKATVGSANISNADREFAEKAAAGSIQLDEASIKRMIKIMDKMGREAVALHNSKVDKVYPEGKGFDRERALLMVPEPSAAAVPDAAPKGETGNGTTGADGWTTLPNGVRVRVKQ